MPVSEEPVQCLGSFIERVSELRDVWWRLAKHKELWFRGEGRDYGETILRPELYRPARDVSLKPIWELLKIENDLYDEFQHNAIERCDVKTFEEDWDWDSYLLMQHHNGPTRLLDWSDGALMALHFALRDKTNDSHDARVYVFESYRLMEKIEGLPDIRLLQEQWKAYVGKHLSYGLNEDEWEDAYLPANEEVLAEMDVPLPPLPLDFDLISRRIAAQRSRFIVFGKDPTWLSEELRKEDSAIRSISIAAASRSRIRQELRDCGVAESVIYPDLDGLGRETRQLWEDRR